MHTIYIDNTISLPLYSEEKENITQCFYDPMDELINKTLKRGKYRVVIFNNKPKGESLYFVRKRQGIILNEYSCNDYSVPICSPACKRYNLGEEFWVKIKKL